MGSKTILCFAAALTGVALLGQNAPAPGQAPGRGRGRGPAGPPLRQVTVTEIPGIVAAGAKWTLVWQGTGDTDGGAPVAEFVRTHGGNADGIVGAKDGGLLFAQEQPSLVRKLDKNGKVSVYIEDTHGTGALAIDAKGRVFGAERTCTDPGLNLKPGECEAKEATKIGIIFPLSERKVIADNFEGKSLGHLNDLVVDKKGGIYFNGSGTYYVDAHGKVSGIAGLDGKPLGSNGIMLSRDEKTFYATNGGRIVAYDVQANGTVNNAREFCKLREGSGGDGMAIDAAGRLYVSTNPGVQVCGPDGTLLGLIPSPRGVISVAFAGPGKKTLYMVGSGALGPDGKEFIIGPGLRNNAKTIFKLQMLAEGFKGRAK